MIKKTNVNRKRKTVEKLNSDIIVKMEKTIEHSPKPAANELRISKRTLAIVQEYY